MNDKLKGISKNDNMKVFNIPLFRIAHTRKEWQKNFSPLSDKDKVELLDSIRREGLLHPIIVWEKEKEDADGHTFEILAGNNRFDIYQYLHQNDADNQYATIPAFCYDHDSIDENQALEIFVDTNYVQRKLKKSEIAYSLKTKLDVLKKRNTPNALKEAANELKIAKTWAYTYSMCNNLIGEFKHLLDEDKITLKMAGKIGHWDAETQRKIYQRFGEDKIKEQLPEKVWTFVPAKTPNKDAITVLEAACNKYRAAEEQRQGKKASLTEYTMESDEGSNTITLKFNKNHPNSAPMELPNGLLTNASRILVW